MDVLKIDGRFVKHMLEDPIDRAMVDAINRIGHMMGLSTVAEFVESPAIIEELRSIGVDFAQGFAISRPAAFELGRPSATAGDEPGHIRRTQRWGGQTCDSRIGRGQRSRPQQR